jgi:hypothetical protein
MSPVAGQHLPDRLYMAVPGLGRYQARACAHQAVSEARRRAPKLSGASSRRFLPIWGEGWFGIYWADSYVWFQETGIAAFTMSKVAGKTIPMWINDPTGEERRNKPDARTRVTASGVVQVLIFRRAARQGQRKRVIGPGGVPREVPASYPGAPGRIAVREAPAPYTTPGRTPGAIAKGNVGVRWRHPGLMERNFLHEGLRVAALAHDIIPQPIYASDR